MQRYPGLGLPLRYDGSLVTDFYPIGAHMNCEGATSDPLPVREVAMMDIMEKLTDKHNWHEKVFNDSVISRWRKEALEIPDTDLWDLATRGKLQFYNNDGSVTVQAHYGMLSVVPLKGIVTEEVFDDVSFYGLNELLILSSQSSVLESSKSKLSTIRRAILSLPLMLAQA